MIKQRIQQWYSETDANVAMIFAIVVSALIPMMYFAIQIRSIESQKFTLQTAADNAALAVVQEISVLSSNSKGLNSLALTQIDANLLSNPNYLAEPKKVEAVLLPANSRSNPSSEPVLEVTIHQLPVAEYQNLFGYPEKKPIVVTARATQIGGETSSNVCVVGLNDSEERTILLNRRAALTANDCVVISNSSSSGGMQVLQQAELQAENIFSSGGAADSPGSRYDPEPILDYPALEDPLRNRPPPTYGGCDYNNFQTNGDEEETLKPGVYCGGIDVFQGSKVTLEPGIYIIDGGALAVQNDASLTGEGVGFYFSGEAARFRFLHHSSVKLSAPVDGPMAGLLFFDERDPKFDDPLEDSTKLHVISSENARSLVGTIYLPKGRLVIDASQPIADESEYTAIVVNQLQLVGEPKLVLNSDYDLTDVPLPDGLNLSQNIGARLIE